MRALVCRSLGSPADLVLERAAAAAPGKGNLVIAVAAAGVNATDVMITSGRYQDRYEPPFVPGSEVAGTVRRVGAGVDPDRIGTPVLAVCRTGGFADEVEVPADHAVRVPDAVDLHHAAAFPIAYGTAYHALVDRAGLRAGDSVLVLGASGAVGTAAVQIAMAMGARVAAVGSNIERLATPVSAGAEAIVVGDPSELHDRWRGSFGPLRADIVVDPVGGDWGSSAQRLLADQGRYLVIGFATGRFPVLEANRLLLRNLTVHGVFGGPFLHPTDPVSGGAISTLLAGLATGRWGPVIARRVPLDRAEAVLADVADRASTAGRVVVVPGAAE